MLKTCFIPILKHCSYFFFTETSIILLKMDRRSRRASSNGGCNGAAVAPTSEHKSCHSNGCPQGHETDSHETPHDSIRVGPNNQSDNMGVSPSTARACCHELSAPSPKHIEPQLIKTENSTLKNTLLFIIVCISLGKFCLIN